MSTTSAPAPGRYTRRVPLGRVALVAFTALVFLYLVFPVLIILPMSFSSSRFLDFPPPGLSTQWYENFFDRADWTDAMVRSLQLAVVVMVAATIMGTMAALALARATFRGKELVNAIVVAPMIVPGIIVAIATYSLFVDLKLVNSFLGVAIAHTMLAIPFVIVNVVATLRGFDIRLEQAAMNLGASPLQTFIRVTLPMIAPGVVAGALFAFITSFDELIVVLFIAGTRGRTLPMRMFEGLRLEIDPTIAAVSSMLIVFSIAMLLSAELFRRRTS